jgi:membrane-associated protease RseP (regulator of RpoE activity)
MDLTPDMEPRPDSQRTARQEAAFIGPLLADLFTIETIYRHGQRLMVTLGYRYERERTNDLLKDRLKLAGYDFTMQETEQHLILEIDPRRRIRIPRINIVLFFVTLFTVYVVPVFYKYGTVPDTIAALGDGEGLVFTAAMISILFVHEMGHFVASRRRGIVTSWPYFIPAPNFIGSFGAIIKSKSPFWNRRDLIEVGAAGPIAGWIVAVIWLMYGFTTATVITTSHIPAGVMYFGEPLVYRLLQPLFAAPVPENASLLLSEALMAGWVGLLVTAINLLPIGQLDGGHILYGLVRRRQAVLGWLGMATLLVLGFWSMLWWVFAAFGLIFGVSHPPTLDDRRPPGRTAVALAVTAIIIMALSFIPIPIRM